MSSEEEIERRNRVRLSLAAYSYELEDHSIMTDAEFDDLAKKIRPEMSTGHEALDAFFRTEFKPYTGSWIHKHPELDRLAALYRRLDWSGT